ncbi:hypothetical protein NLJ89_g4528 [Agrocybe chaxingu]|uniref:DUF6533 domain-containing protein n=1 Tax=Agrocybe chaxingu TaxID=84603 RepID=A0A9W8K1X8_9AGAR|nr:hypothetical protein NLJ89_g4528 [Agrocybe chaxingu]
MSDLDAQTLADSIVYTRIVSYVNAGSFAVLFFDSLLTLNRELVTIWQSKWNYTKFMYILTRYSTFVEAGVVIYQLSIPGDWYKDCALAFKTNAREIIMTIRTWAVWGKNPVLRWFLPTFYLLVWAGGFGVTGYFLSTLEFEPNPRTPYVGCYATYASPIIFVSWVLLLVYDTIMFVLMIIPAWRAYRMGGSSRLIRVVYRDGLMYYLYLFGFSLVNIIVILTAPGDLFLVISLLSRVFHALLACRVVLHIGEHARPVLGSQSNSRSDTTASHRFIRSPATTHGVSFA